jgi:hypothetical protein
MQSSTLIVLLILCSAVYSIPNKYSDRYTDEKKIPGNFILIGGTTNHENNQLEKVKPFRSHHYPIPTMILSHKPSEEYYSTNMAPTHGSALINANVQLLEPFMVVTFILFVLKLIERARMASRSDFEFYTHPNYRNEYMNDNLYKKNITDY